MEVLILNASPRRNGVTSTLLNEIENHIASKHVVEAVSIHALQMKPRKDETSEIQYNGLSQSVHGGLASC
jgi:NAD(P)H-dependent FMN reductase